MSSAKRAITAPSLSKETKSLMKNKKSNGERTEPWSRPWVKHRLELKTLKSWKRPLRCWGKIESSGWMLKECQCLVCGAVVFLSKQYRMLCWNQEVPIRSVSLGVVGAIFNFLDYSSNLIFTAPCFTKTSWESTEHVAGFINIVEKVSKNAFQKSDDTWREADGMEKDDFTWRFPSFE